MKRQIRYALMDPSGNRTILVRTPVPVEEQAQTASRLMSLEPTAEQAGFLTFPDEKGGTLLEDTLLEDTLLEDTLLEDTLSLRMAGGEFCGNATMSTAVYYGMKRKLRSGMVRVKVSGVPEPLQTEIRALTDDPAAPDCAAGIWMGRVRMPRPVSIRMERLEEKTLPVVSFPGITHVILQEKMTRGEAEARAKCWCRLLEADALGLMFLEQGGEEDAFSARNADGRDVPDQTKEWNLIPLVYVPAADTLFWEKACGSGTTAVGAWSAFLRKERVSLSLKQPGGVLGIDASETGELFLTGTVKCLYEKTVYCF